MQRYIYILFLVFSISIPSLLKSDNLEETRQFFVDKINERRAALKLPKLERWHEAEACADRSVLTDIYSNVAHIDVKLCEESAQVICPTDTTLERIKAKCVEGIFDQGPLLPLVCVGTCYRDFENYINITNASYTKVAVGMHKMSNGRYLVKFNFK